MQSFCYGAWSLFTRVLLSEYDDSAGHSSSVVTTGVCILSKPLDLVWKEKELFNSERISSREKLQLFRGEGAITEKIIPLELAWIATLRQHNLMLGILGNWLHCMVFFPV